MCVWCVCVCVVCVCVWCVCVCGGVCGMCKSLVLFYRQGYGVRDKTESLRPVSQSDLAV